MLYINSQVSLTLNSVVDKVGVVLEYRTVTSTISSPMNYCLLLMAVT